MRSSASVGQAAPERQPGAAPEEEHAANGQHFPAEGRRRVVIEDLRPRVDGGEFAVKRVVGETVRVEADIFTDGHDQITAQVLHRRDDRESRKDWTATPMSRAVNDRWAGEFPVLAQGWYEFTVRAWIDHFNTWRTELRKRLQTGEDLSVQFEIGTGLINDAARQSGAERRRLEQFAARLKSGSPADRLEAALDDGLASLMAAEAPRRFATDARRVIRVWADRPRARFSAWYEFFPRSARNDGVTHGAFDDVIGQLNRIAAMGFDVLYVPPIHPIGRAFRKGKNNSLQAGPDDVGSPWAIGAQEGGHDAIHPLLGTEQSFRRLVHEANRRGIEIALDLALQCSPDHPYVREHPEWFKHRPDGTIQYAENPPKKYQDIYPFDFETDSWRELWDEVLRVVLLWMDRGVRIFRVDNPHTKPFALWEWLIWQAKKRDAGVLFLAEAFTRPKVMHRLAKLGFSQSYTYFAWRNGPVDLRQYFEELTQTPAADYFRPNAWPNTPDILPEYLQHGGRSAFMVRAILAATLCASWGVYGPAFELLENRPLKPGSEEYLDSEKYQLRAWNPARPDSLELLLASLNSIRRDNAALQQDRTLTFHPCDNPAIVCYSKHSGDNTIVVAANTNPHEVQWGTVDLDLSALGVEQDKPYQMHDLLTDARYRWQGRRNYVGLDPATQPAHVFRLRRHERTEAQFEYFI